MQTERLLDINTHTQQTHTPTHTCCVNLHFTHGHTHTQCVSGIYRYDFTIYHICNMFVFFSLRFFHKTHTHTHTLGEVSGAEERTCVRRSGNRASVFSLLSREPAFDQHTIRTLSCLPCEVCALDAEI